MSLAESAPAPDQQIPGLTPPARRGRSPRFIGDIVVDLGYASREAVEAAIAESRASGRRTGEVLVERGVLTPDQLARVVAERFGVDQLDLGIFKVDMSAANLLPASSAKRYGAVPVKVIDDRTLLVAMIDPGNVLAIDDISLMSGYEVRAAVAAEQDINALIQRLNALDEVVVAEAIDDEDGAEVVDVRVATLPLVGGESAVMRVLDKDGAVIDLDKLGMVDPERERFVKAFTRPHGAVLVTGPTGSGKTTTLYGALQMLHTPEKNIITIEDPVEYELSGIKQMQVNTKAGLQFATGLRSMMRADPDIIMVGEIRDRETAQIAVEAALTGHLVLSTLHTNDAPGAVARLIEMGIEPFLVGSAVDCVVAQRLARLLCEECKRRTTITADVMRANGFNVGLDLEAYEPVGCARCGGSGYRGRIGLYEVMWVSDTIRALAVAREPAETIAHAAVHEGMMRLREDGLEKVRRGLTSIAEIARVAGTR